MSCRIAKVLWRKLRTQSYVVPLFLYGIAGAMSVTAQAQYLYRRVAAEHVSTSSAGQINVSSSGNISVASCGGGDDDEVQAQVSAETSRWVLWQALSGDLPAISTIVLLGSFSDVVGRRFLFLVPQVAFLLSTVLTCLVIHLQLPLWVLCVGQGMEGASGGASSMLIATFSTSCDLHTVRHQQTETELASPAKTGGTEDNASLPRHLSKNSSDVHGDVTLNPGHNKPLDESSDVDVHRGLRMLLVECCLILTRGCVIMGNGYFIRDFGFLYPTVTAGAVCLACLLFTIVYVRNPETAQVHQGNKNILEPLKLLYRSVSGDRRKMWSLFLCNTAFAVIVFGDGGLYRTLSVYQMSPPFCWTSIEIGWFTAEKFSVVMLSVPLLMTLKRFSMREATMACIGTLINALAEIVYYVVKDWFYVFFVVPVLVMPGMLPYALTRSITSRLAGPQAHGAMLSLTSLLELSVSLLGSVAGSSIYQTSVRRLRSVIFLYFGAIYFLAALLYFLAVIVDRRLAHRESQVQALARTTSRATGAVHASLTLQ